jgi:hypothetical protein
MRAGSASGEVCQPGRRSVGRSPTEKSPISKVPFVGVGVLRLSGRIESQRTACLSGRGVRTHFPRLATILALYCFGYLIPKEMPNSWKGAALMGADKLILKLAAVIGDCWGSSGDRKV